MAIANRAKSSLLNDLGMFTNSAKPKRFGN